MIESTNGDEDGISDARKTDDGAVDIFPRYFCFFESIGMIDVLV